MAKKKTKNDDNNKTQKSKAKKRPSSEVKSKKKQKLLIGNNVDITIKCKIGEDDKTIGYCTGVIKKIMTDDNSDKIDHIIVRISDRVSSSQRMDTLIVFERRQKDDEDDSAPSNGDDDYFDNVDYESKVLLTFRMDGKFEEGDMPRVRIARSTGLFKDVDEKKGKYYMCNYRKGNKSLGWFVEDSESSVKKFLVIVTSQINRYHNDLKSVLKGRKIDMKEDAYFVCRQVFHPGIYKRDRFHEMMQKVAMVVKTEFDENNPISTYVDDDTLKNFPYLAGPNGLVIDPSTFSNSRDTYMNEVSNYDVEGPGRGVFVLRKQHDKPENGYLLLDDIKTGSGKAISVREVDGKNKKEKDEKLLFSFMMVLFYSKAPENESRKKLFWIYHPNMMVGQQVRIFSLRDHVRLKDSGDVVLGLPEEKGEESLLRIFWFHLEKIEKRKCHVCITMKRSKRKIPGIYEVTVKGGSLGPSILLKIDEDEKLRKIVKKELFGKYSDVEHRKKYERDGYVTLDLFTPEGLSTKSVEYATVILEQYFAEVDKVREDMFVGVKVFIDEFPLADYNINSGKKDLIVKRIVMSPDYRSSRIFLREYVKDPFAKYAKEVSTLIFAHNVIANSSGITKELGEFFSSRIKSVTVEDEDEDGDQKKMTIPFFDDTYVSKIRLLVSIMSKELEEKKKKKDTKGISDYLDKIYLNDFPMNDDASENINCLPFYSMLFSSENDEDGVYKSKMISSKNLCIFSDTTECVKFSYFEDLLKAIETSNMKPIVVTRGDVINDYLKVNNWKK